MPFKVQRKRRCISLHTRSLRMGEYTSSRNAMYISAHYVTDLQ